MIEIIISRNPDIAFIAAIAFLLGSWIPTLARIATTAFRAFTAFCRRF